MRGIYVMDLCTKTQQKIDMICQHKADVTIIPIKFRMVDDDGLFQEYKIKAYRVPDRIFREGYGRKYILQQ